MAGGMTERAVRAAVAVAGEHGVRCDEPRVLADGYSTVVHLAPAPVVARVPTVYTAIRPGSGWRAREVDVVRHLQEQGAPVVPISDELPPRPHERDGLVVTFWTHVPPLTGVDVTERDLARALPDLHRALRSYPGPLPVLAGPAHDIPVCLDVLGADPGPLDASRVRLLHRVHDQLRPLVEDPPGPLQPVHGDVFPGNVLPTRHGLLWCDLEGACLAPLAWDLANLRPDPDDRRALDAYPDPPTDDDLAPFVELRTLQVVTFVAAAPPVAGFSEPDRSAMLDVLMRRWT